LNKKVERGIGMKHLVLFLLLPAIALTGLYADDDSTTTNAESPDNYMDSPVGISTLPPVFGIEFHDDLNQILRTDSAWWVNNYIENTVEDIGIGHVLEYLANLDQHQHHNNGAAIKYSGYHDLGYVSGNVDNFTGAISSFLSNFPASSEVFNSVIAQGESTFFNALGEQTGSANPEEIYSGTQDADTMAVYAGRNTGAAPYGIGANGDYTNQVKLATITTPSGVFEVNAFGVYTPIVLDMDGDKRLQASKGQWLPHSVADEKNRRAFDINGDGFPEVIEWVGPNDGLLVQYDGGEINGTHLFGDAGGFTHGFEKLSLLDKDGNGVLENEELETLSVWQDKNGNAKADEGEVLTVQELNITSIGVKHRLFTASFEQNGETKMLWDWHPATHIVKKIK
jgi:hypothetical protein